MLLSPDLLSAVRDRFHHVDTCPYQGPRVFFENAGGSLTLKAAVERTAEIMAFPDNQGRTNIASQELGKLIATGREDMFTLFGASSGRVFIGETGTELLGRVIRSAIWATDATGIVGSHLEHPATYSPCLHWAPRAGKVYTQVPFNPETSVVTVDEYRPALTPDTGVATIIQASPVTGMHVDVDAIAREIRAVAPECFIIVDGIQHAAHGRIDVDQYDIDAYVVSGYKLFSRHNFGVAWVSERLAHAPHEQLAGSAADSWELGTRDTSAYAAFSEVVRYLEWLGLQAGGSTDDGSRQLIERAATAIRGHERAIVDAMVNGTPNSPGLAQIGGVSVVGPANSEHRSGMVSFEVEGHEAPAVVDALNEAGVRTHARKRDHYSAGILVPLGVESCVRASISHYNSLPEVEQMLDVVAGLAGS